MEARGDGARSDPPWVPIPGTPLAEQAELFGSIAMSAPYGVIASDLEGTVVWANPVATEMFGWSREDLIGKPFTVLVSPADHDRVRGIRERVLNGEHTAPFLATGRRRNGETVDVSTTLGVRRDAQGSPLGTSMFLRDVTEELRLQRDLTEVLARSRARFDQSAHPQALLDVQGRFAEVNDAACALLGRQPVELLGRDSTELVHPTDPEHVSAQLARLRDGSLRAARYEATGLTKDDGEVPLLVDVTAVDGRAELVMTAQDLTGLREAESRLASQEAFFRALNREASDVTLVSDRDGRLVYVTPSMTQVLGYDREQVMRTVGQDVAHPDDLAGLAELRRRLREVPGTRERFTMRVKDAQGQWRWFEVTGTNCVDDPDIGGIVVNLREVTAERQAERALRESEARFRAIAETAQEGILAVSPEGDVLFANERLTDILDMPLRDIYGLSRKGIFAPSEAAAVARRLADRSREDGPERYDFPYRHPDGTTRVLSVSASVLTAADGSVLGSLAMISDVTSRRESEESLRRAAMHDALTALPNRLLFLDRLATADARQQRSHGRGVAVLFLDLDGFKQVNDVHGHATGDRVLTQVAERVAEAVRSTDTVARIGGDEFAVICEDTDTETATAVASRIQKSLEAPVAIEGERFLVSVSIGIALSPPYPVTELLRLADLAMYQAKAAPHGTAVVYHDSAS